MKTLEVTQMNSTRTGNPVPNQFEIHTDKYIYFQSYNILYQSKMEL